MVEPFGYFRAEPFGWTDCAEGEEGAVALYEGHHIVEADKMVADITEQRDMLLDALKRILRTAAPEWEIESGVPGYDLACYNARMVIKEVTAAAKKKAGA